MEISITFVIPGDELRKLPPQKPPMRSAAGPAQIPAKGDVISFSPESNWLVLIRRWDYSKPDQLKVQLFLTFQEDGGALEAQQ